jgi:hypothetical protein
MISASTGTRIVKSLQRKRLIEVVEINLGGKGGNAKFLVLTEKAFEVLGMPQKHYHSKGGSFEHYFWQYKLAEHFKVLRKDWQVNIENQVMNKFIDLTIETQGKILAVEIAQTSVNEYINIEKDLEAGCDFVIIGSKDNKVLEEVNQIKISFDQAIREKVGICLLHKLLRCNSISEVIDLEKLRSIENLTEGR